MASETHYTRVDRNNLVADTNLIIKGSLNETITSPSSGILWSRIGGRTTEFKYPLPGYCIRFNSSNQSAYIQTTVRSSERDKYKIIIKGEGTVDHLYVDTSGENIAIKQMYPINDSSYFDLSYIAFLNKTTGYLEHLYECEEAIKNQVTLLDAIRCNHATLTDVTSLDAMRTYTKYKEWIADYSNLDDKIECVGGAYAGFLITKDYNTSLIPLNGENTRSYCLTLELKKDFDVTKFNSGIELIGDFTDGGTGRKYGHGFTFYKNSSFGCCFGIGSNRVAYETSFNTLLTGVNNWSIKIIPAGIYKLCLIVNIAEDAANSYIKTYCNGVNTWTVTSLNQTNKVIDVSTIKYGTESDAIDMFKILSQFGGNYQPNYNLPCQISNVRVFGFDVSLESAAYTVEDYINDKQIDNPSTFPGVLLYYDNLSYYAYNYANNYKWLDRGPKKIHLFSQNSAGGTSNLNRMEFPCKNYGTWLSNVGYYNSGDYHEPRAIASGGVIFELSSDMQFEHYWKWKPGTGKVEGYFEEDGTLVCKVAEEVTLVEPFSLPDLRLVGGLNAINGSCINSGQEVRITYNDFYLNSDVYLITAPTAYSSYGKGIYLCETRVEPEWFYHPKDYKGTIVSFINSSNFGIGPYAARSKSGQVETIPVGTILWKVKGFKVELLP